MPELLIEEAPATPVVTRPKRAPRPPRQPKKPDVETFKEIVMRHCGYMNVTSVAQLCDQQNQGLIDELAQHFG